jgi:hypothetical protein
MKSSAGGHFYSLLTISGSLGEKVRYSIINIGKAMATPLRGNTHSEYIGLQPFNFPLKFFVLLRKAKSISPDVIHAFDIRSLYVARCLQMLIPCKVVYTKCGGQNGGDFIPDADEQILFSHENLEHFKSHGNPEIPKHLLPNRVKGIEADQEAIEQIREELQCKDKFVILRIARFNEYYNLSFQQSIKLLEEVRKVKPNSTLLLIGKIQSESFFNQLKEKCSGLPVHFITEPSYTKNASRLLGIADLIVATGRGVMEACSLNLPVYAPVQGSSLPLQVNDNTITYLLSKNFSERSSLDDGSFADSVFHVKQLDHQKETFGYFNKYFSVEAVHDEYLSIYQNIVKVPFDLSNFLSHTMRYFKPI